jgi:predicted dehydrogenase/threonine dehydrogenase-like Zn-dependent dehydrogenase
MKSVITNLGTGVVEACDVPSPRVSPHEVLIRASRSALSPGTERMLIDFGRSGWIERARSQPDKARQVIDKVRTDGLFATVDSIRGKIDQPVPLGYSNAGVAIALGAGVIGISSGDRVICNGRHAEIVAAPSLMCARIPSSVSDDDAAFTVVAAVALQGVRLAQPALGESVVVIGLGLIGLFAVQLLRAYGCQVLALDFDPHRLDLARSFGAQVVNLSSGADPISAAGRLSSGRGVDSVLITAGTDSSAPVHQAALMCRKRGRIVLIGVTGLSLSRDDFYKKELTFQVSCSYGPGRYDPSYEERGQDYPVGYVRWTAQRNFEAVLQMMSEGKLKAEPLITHRFRCTEAAKAYDLLHGDEPHLGILLEYPVVLQKELLATTISLRPPTVHKSTSGTPLVAVIGAGNFATRVLLPAMKRTEAELAVICSTGGISALHAGRKFGFRDISTDVDETLNRGDINTVVILTRHDTHSRFVCQALRAGKHVFVEKPLALTLAEIDEIQAAHAAAESILMVGFNRRFAPQIVNIQSVLSKIQQPKAFIYTINAGMVPPEHWTQDIEAGGGRVIGEACHFIDLLRHLSGAKITVIQSVRLADDIVTINLQFADGSIGSIHYFANGHKAVPKERLEIYCGGRVIRVDDFRKLQAFGWPELKHLRLWTQDKGHRTSIAAFIKSVASRSAPPIPFDEILEVSRATIEAAGQSTKCQH